MKKILTLVGGALLLMQSLTAMAETRKWDFRNWSSATVANLMAGDDWTDIEKATATEPTDISRNNCFWEVGAAGTAAGVELTANGEPIAELSGLLYTNTTARSLAIAVNYGVADAASSFGPYNGPSYLWFGGSKKNYFIIPNVKPGSKIKMGVESHKITDARGVNLYVGHGTSGTQLKSPTGESVPAPKTYTEQEWLVPVDLTDTPNEDGTYDIQIYNTNGCHLYYIEVSDAELEINAMKIGYVYDSSYPGYSQESDLYYSVLGMVAESGGGSLEALDAAGDLSAVDYQALLGYDVVVVSNTVSPATPFAATLKQAIAYTPMLNFNAGLYETWGYGTAVTTGVNVADVPATEVDNILFKSVDEGVSYVDENGKLLMLADGSLTGVSIPAGSYFASDKILATVGGTPVIHVHNNGRNTYVYLPYSFENQNYPEDNFIFDLVVNTVAMLSSTKADVPQAAAPTFTESYKNLATDVKISSGTRDAAIYYTVDGSEPTSASALYTEPVAVNAEGVTIKAIAYADGYNPSEVAEFAVNIYGTTEPPVFSVEQQDGKAVVTLTTTDAGVNIYYNVSGSNKMAESTIYTEPIELNSYTVLTAFTGETENKKQSENVTKEIIVNGKQVRIDVVSHFDANREDWSDGESKAKYYTEGKKNGYNFYTTHEETVKASDGVTDSTIVVVDGPANVLTEWNPGKGWAARSYGQGMLWENITPSADVDDSNTANRYRGVTALDFGASSCSVHFGNIQKSDGVHNDPYSCHIISTEAFQAPFDITVFVGNTSSSNLPHASVYVSATPEVEDSWVKVDTVGFGTTTRYIKKNTMSYEGTDKVYVKLQAEFSSIMVFDIIITNNGEKSQEVNGIREITDEKAVAGEVVRTIVYSINGTQLDRAAKGINIVKDVYANGAVKTRKVMVK